MPLNQQRRFEVDNCGLTTLTYAADRPDPWRLVTLNEIAHLDEVTNVRAG